MIAWEENMGPKPMDPPKPWPTVGGTQAEANTRNAMRQIKEYYAPPHGALPGPHERASSTS